jgi:hypothetical protein
MNPLDVKPGNIWQYKQNKPSLIAKDMAEIYGVPPEGTLRILMARGVFKWLAVRRELIKFKIRLKAEITRKQVECYFTKKGLPCNNNPASHYRYGYYKGYHDALTRCRNEIRTLCHSERWKAPDNDGKALMVLHGGPLFGGSDE